jgi:hypothetical protein
VFPSRRWDWSDGTVNVSIKALGLVGRYGECFHQVPGLVGLHGIFPSRCWDWMYGTVYSHRDADDDYKNVASLANLGCGRPLQGCETYYSHQLRMLSHNSPVIEKSGDDILVKNRKHLVVCQQISQGAREHHILVKGRM